MRNDLRVCNGLTDCLQIFKLVLCISMCNLELSTESPCKRRSFFKWRHYHKKGDGNKTFLIVFLTCSHKNSSKYFMKDLQRRSQIVLFVLTAWRHVFMSIYTFFLRTKQKSSNNIDYLRENIIPIRMCFMFNCVHLYVLLLKFYFTYFNWQDIFRLLNMRPHTIFINVLHFLIFL